MLMGNLSSLTTMESFHNINRVKPARVLITNTESIFTDYIWTYTGNVSHSNANPGLQRIKFGDDVYAMNIADTISGDDYLRITSRSNIFYTNNGVVNHIIPYRVIVDKNNSIKRTIYGTVNGVLDGFVLCGNTTLSSLPDPTNAARLESIHDFTITCRNPATNITYQLPIKLPNNIKSLPSGLHDTLIVDTYNKKAYILFKIARAVLSGNETYLMLSKGGTSSTFFLSRSDAIVGQDNNSINCNYFPTVTYNDIQNEYNRVGISTGINDSARGIFIKIPNNVLSEVSVKAFKKFLNDKFLHNPVIIEYAMRSTQYRSALLDEYCLNSYYPRTEITLDVNTKAGFFVRSVAKI